MHRRIISVIFVALLTVVCSPDLIKGQSVDSLLYLLDNDLVKDDAEKYDLLLQVIDDINDPESKIQYCDQAIELAQKLDTLPAMLYVDKGRAYLNFGDYTSALESYMTAARYYKTNEDNAGVGKAYNYMAETYNFMGDRENEKLYLQKAIEIFEQENDSIYLRYALHNLGYTNYSMGQYDTALVLYTKTLDLFKELKTPYAIKSYFVCLGNLGLVYSRLSDIDKAEEYLLTAIDTLVKIGDNWYVPEFMTGYAGILKQKGEINQAISYASRALETTVSPYYERDASRLLAQLYEISGMIDSAYYYQSIFIAANDSVKNIDNVQRMANLRTEYEVGMKQAEVDVLQKKKRTNNIISIGLGIILLLAIGLVTLYYTYLKRSRKLTKILEERRVLLEKQSSELKERNDEVLKANEELKQLNDEINAQKEEIETQRDYLFSQKEAITESISYAKRIQSAMLPPVSYVEELLNEVFVLFKPRDIVSGDFYWVKQVNQLIIVAAADCTGHGVPGAFMSMLGMSYLNEIVQRREITQANQVLNQMRHQIKQSLRQHGHPDETKDGIDMALCVFDKKTRMIQYAGANRPLYIVQEANGKPELVEIKADRMPLGYYAGKEKSFTNHETRLEIGDTFYLFSDGFVDQKGGKDIKKYMSINFKRLLLKINDQPMYDQQKTLDKELVEWMGNNPQVDDIMIIGVRV